MRFVPLFLGLAFLMLFTAEASAHRQKILLIESYHSAYLWDASYRRGLDQVLGDKYKILNFEMDTKRLPPSEFETRARKAWETYEHENPALVILGDDNALKYLGPKLAATSTPVVYLGINNNPRNYGMVGQDNITGVLERPLLYRSVIMIREILDIKKVLVLLDSGTTAKVLHEEIFNGRDTISLSKVDLHIQMISGCAPWKDAVLTAKEKGYDALIIGLYHTLVDNDGSHVDEEEIITWSSAHTPVPPFGFWDFSVGPDKNIGGYVLVGETQGITAGKMAAEILSGKNPGAIPPATPEKGRFLFSRSQLYKWRIILPDRIADQAEFTQ